MRSTPAIFSGQPTFECRVRFTGRLTGVSLSPVEEAAEPSIEGKVRQPEASPAPPPPPRPPQPETTPPTTTVDFWQTEAGKELLAERQRIDAVLNQIRQTVADFRKEQANRLREWQRAAVELALTIATRLLHERVQSGEFPIEARVRDMIVQLEEDAPVTIHLNPADLELLTSRLGGAPLLPGRDDPRLVPNPELARGECRVESRETLLLSDVTRELQEIREELLRSVGYARS
jgi:hypothetical protein